MQHLEHLALDAGEQGHVDVENFVECLLELPGVRLSGWRISGAAHSWGGAAGGWSGGAQVGGRRERERWAPCRRPRSPSRDVLDAMTHAPSSIGRIEFTRIVVGCRTNTRSTQA